MRRTISIQVSEHEGAKEPQVLFTCGRRRKPATVQRSELFNSFLRQRLLKIVAAFSVDRLSILPGHG